MDDTNIKMINDLITFIDHSRESKIYYDPAAHGASIAAIDSWTEPDVISVEFGSSLSVSPELSGEFITRLRTFLDQGRPNIFNLLLEAPMLSINCLSIIGSKLLNELDRRIQVSILVIIPTQTFATAFVKWRKKDFRCNHLFLAKLGTTVLSNAFWDSFQLGEDLNVVTIEDIDGEKTAELILRRFNRPQSSVQLLRLGNIKNVPIEFFHEALNVAGEFDTLPLGMEIKMDGERFFTSIRGGDRSKAIEGRIKALISADDIYQCKHLKMMFIGTGGKASGKTSTIRSLFGKSFKPDLAPTQCAEVVAQVQVPTDHAMQENTANEWTVYSMKKAALRGYDAVSLKRSGALFTVYDFGTNSQLFKPVLNNSCIVMLCINLMDMKRDADEEERNLVNTLDQITKKAPLAPVIIIGTHADEFPSPAALKDLDKKLFIKLKSVNNHKVQPNAQQRLFFFPIENSRGEMNEQLEPIRLVVGTLVRRAQEAKKQSNDAGRRLLLNAKNNDAEFQAAAALVNNRPETQLYYMDEFGIPANAYFLNEINKSDSNLIMLGRIQILGDAMGLPIQKQGQLISYYRAIGLVIYISIEESENFTLNRHVVLKPNWLYQSFAKLIYDPIENTKVYDVPPEFLDGVDNYERTGQATTKVLEALLDGMKEYEKEYIIELAIHWGLMTKIADSADGDAQYAVDDMVPTN